MELLIEIYNPFIPLLGKTVKANISLRENVSMGKVVKVEKGVFYVGRYIEDRYGRNRVAYLYDKRNRYRGHMNERKAMRSREYRMLFVEKYVY
jgi:hypothetical protein